MIVIDSHCHFDFACFDSQRNDLNTRFKAAGVKRIVVPGVNIKNCTALPSFAEQYNCDFALGLHPYFLNEYKENNLTQLDSLMAEQVGNSRWLAVGECGLDFSLAPTLNPLQVELFEQQVGLANKYAKPLIIHHRKSIDQITSYLNKVSFSHGGIFHAFAGSYQQANKIIELGFKLGVGGTITYPRAIKTRDVIRQVPLETIVLETDSPDMPVMGKQGEINTPLNLTQILTTLIELRPEPKEQIIEQCIQNTINALNIDGKFIVP